MLPVQITALWAYLKAKTQARGTWDEAGSAVEKVILTAIFAAIAIVALFLPAALLAQPAAAGSRRPDAP